MCDPNSTGWNIVKTIFPRLFFVIQIFLTVWRVATIFGPVYWCLILLLIFLVIDTVYTIAKRKGQEFKWASTSFLAFLIGAVPPIWLLEIDRIDRWDMIKANHTALDGKEEGLSKIMGFHLPLMLEGDMWVKILQQTFILLLIPVRWILPRGPITRDRLSQILLVYVALGADIIELLDLYDIEAVMNDRALFYAILAVWTLSLIQFVFLLASSSSQKARFAFMTPLSEQREHEEEKAKAKEEAELRRDSLISVIDHEEPQKCSKVEAGALAMTLLCQDIPFLILRMYILVAFREFSNTLLFFISKNIYVIMLQFYRMCIVSCCPTEEDSDHDGFADDRQDLDPAKPVAITVAAAPEAVDNSKDNATPKTVDEVKANGQGPNSTGMTAVDVN